MAGGRPPKYATPEEMQEAIDDYFTNCPDKVNIGDEIVSTPTITGLALHLGFSCRQSMYDYESKKEFSYTIKSAKARMERIYEASLLYGKNSAGAIFALKNFGWTDKQELEVSRAEITPDMIKEFEQKLLR